MRRLKSLLVSFGFLQGLLEEGLHSASYRVIEHAIPKDARLVNVRHAWENPDQIELLIESESFDEVAEGALIPKFTPMISGEPFHVRSI